MSPFLRLRTALVLAPFLALVACGSSDSSKRAAPTDGDSGSDAGSRGGKGSGGKAGAGGARSGGATGSGGRVAAGGASAGGAGTGGASAGGAGTGGGADDAGPDSSDAQVPDGAPDAAPDAADASDGGGPFNTLYAHIGGQLVTVDPATGALTEVGPTGQTYIVLTWDAAAKVVRVIADPYSPLGANPVAPRVGTIDLCTGVVTATTSLSVGAAPVRRAEGLARHPDTGAFWISYGIAGSSTATQYVSESTGTVDLATGVVTHVGEHQTYQDDGDLLVFVGSTLHLLDVSQGIGKGGIYSINLADGASTLRWDVGPNVLRFAEDPSRGKIFVAFGAQSFTNRGIGTLNVDTGESTLIGSYLPPATYAGLQFTSLISVPAPKCP